MGGRGSGRASRRGVRARGSVRCAAGSWDVDGDEAFIDESAGYHARHTTWHWSAGIGRTRRRARGGVEPRRRRARRARAPASGRCGWTASPSELPPLAFAEDLSRVGDLRFTPWSAREDHTAPARSSGATTSSRSAPSRASCPAASGWRRVRRDGVARRQVVSSSAEVGLDLSRFTRASCRQVIADGPSSPPPEAAVAGAVTLEGGGACACTPRLSSSTATPLGAPEAVDLDPRPAT